METADQGVFFWKRRYRTHRLYHRSKANQVAHFIGTPLQLFSFVKLLSLVSLGGSPGGGWNSGLLLVVFLSLVYCQIHLWIGLIASSYLLGCWYLSSYVFWSDHWYLNLLIAGGFFFAGVIIQVGLGHQVFQKEDTNLNAEFTEFFQTYDPMIFVLIFFFPFLDLFLGESDLTKKVQ